MRIAVVASLLAIALPTLPALAAEPETEGQLGGKLLFKKQEGGGCTIRVGPNDRVAQDADLVIKAGGEVESAIALRGSVILQRGARVKKAVAAGGSVRVEAGALVTGEAVSVGGDVQVAAGGRVDGEAISLGGRVRIAEGGTVSGSVTSLSLQLAGLDLERELREKIGAGGKCQVEPE
jgi:cytoskeletal protein CcmA (bactofilin family)